MPAWRAGASPGPLSFQRGVALESILSLLLWKARREPAMLGSKVELHVEQNLARTNRV